MRDLADRTLPAAWLGLWMGSLAGVAEGWWLTSGAEGEVLAREPAARIALVLLLSSVGGLVSATVLLALAAMLRIVQGLFARMRRVDPVVFCASAYGVGLLAIHLFLVIAFRVTRELSGPIGLASLSALAVGATGSWVGLNVLAARRRPRARRARLLPFALLLGGQLAVGCLSLDELHARSWRSALDDIPDQALASVRVGRPWNVLLVSIDTLRPDHLSTYGYRRPTSPVLDALAAEGATFLHARSQAPWTLPSHASLFTSLYPSGHGAQNFNPVRFLGSTRIDHLVERNVTLAEILRAGGYRTTSIASTAWLGHETGLMQGFDSVDNQQRENKAPGVVDRAIAALGRKDGQPFFLFLHFFDVHDYAAPPAFASEYVDPGYRGKLASAQGLFAFRSGLYDRVSKEDLEYAAARYDGAIRFVDSELGRLLDFMRSEQLLESTLVIVCSDHGEELWEHGSAGHGHSLYEEQLRVPLIVRPPSSTPVANRRPDAAVGLLDVTPTILDYLEVQPSFAWMQGVSLRALTEPGGALPPRTFFGEAAHTRHSRALFRDGAKYIANRVRPFDLLELGYLVPNVRALYKFRDDELFLLQEDPQESRSVRGERRDLAERYRRELLERTRATTPAAGASRAEGAEATESTLESLRSLGYVR